MSHTPFTDPSYLTGSQFSRQEGILMFKGLTASIAIIVAAMLGLPVVILAAI